MAKRRHQEEEELPFVALMDTMTNVVGVLIIVLVMVGLGIATTVKRVLSELPPVTPEQLAKLEEEMAKPKIPDTPESVQKKIDESIDKTKKMVQELKTVDLADVQQSVKFMDLSELQKKLELAKKDRETQKTELDKLFAEVDKLKKALDDTPVYQPPPPKYVRIPNPRPMPENAVKEQFMIVKGRVIYLNESQFLSAVMAEFEKNKKAFLKPGAPPDKPVYLAPKILEHFSRARIGDRTMAATVEQAAPTSPALFMKLVPLPGAGDDVLQVKNPASFFQRAMRKFKSEPGKVVSLNVAADSVETYLEARTVADSVGVPVVWQISPLDYHRVRMPGIVLDVPPVKPSTAPPARPSEIKPPTEQID